MRPGVMEDLGLDAPRMRAAHPRPVYSSLWAFGSKGPMKLKPGYEPIVQAFAGIVQASGRPACTIVVGRVRVNRAATVVIATRLLVRAVGGDLFREGEDLLVPAIPHQQISEPIPF
jgi:crotonobetainyl-CoA:carnitine CoA-transferase CaiB-like acyl-CoA transferase